MGRKKYNTEEERLAAIRESKRKYAENNPEKVKESKRKWRENNPDYMKEWREENPDYDKEWRQEHPDYDKQRYQENSDKVKEIVRKYQSTPIGRANTLASSYRRNDKIHNRGECTITAQWIVDNIFTSKCRYCQNDDWTELGCDRIDNDLPHTTDNVVPCCEGCNTKRGRKTFEEFLKEMGQLSPS